MIRQIARACHNVIGDVLRLRDVGGTVVPVGIAGKMPRRASLQRKGHLTVVPRDNPCVSRCRRSRQICSGRERMAVVPVIDLRRVCNRVVCIVYSEAGLIDAAACDRARPVLRICDGIVPAKGIADARVLHRTAARIHICGKRRVCSIAKATGHAREIDIPRRVAVCAKHGVARRAVTHGTQCFLRVGIRPVIDFCCRTERERHGTRRDFAETGQRRCPRHGRRIGRRIEGIVVRFLGIRRRKGNVIGHVLRRRNAARIGDVL